MLELHCILFTDDGFHLCFMMYRSRKRHVGGRYNALSKIILYKLNKAVQNGKSLKRKGGKVASVPRKRAKKVASKKKRGRPSKVKGKRKRTHVQRRRRTKRKGSQKKSTKKGKRKNYSKKKKGKSRTKKRKISSKSIFD